jgi:hypothetical protein
VGEVRMLNHVLGRDPFDVEALARGMFRNDYARAGEIAMSGIAIATVEIACWHIIGKALNHPIYRLLGGAFHAAELDCVNDAVGAPKPVQAAPTAVPARPAQPQPVQSQPIQPVQAQPVAPVQSQSVDPVQAQPVGPVQSQEITPAQGQTLPAPSSCTPVDPSCFIYAYKTNVGGAAYTQDDLVNDQQLLFTSPGAISGGLLISADGTYEWTTAHSGHMTGNWVVDPTNSCGAITLLQALQQC